MLPQLTRVAACIYRYATSDGPRYLIRVKWIRNGRAVEYRKGGLPSKTLAQSYLDKLRGQKVEERFFPERAKREVPTLRDYSTRWLTQCEARGLRNNTLRCYRHNVEDHLIPAFGDLRLTEITRPLFRDLLIRKQDTEKLSANSLRLIAATLSKMLSDAQDEGLITANPCLRPGTITQLRSRQAEIHPFTWEEEQRLLQTAKAYSLQHYAFILTMLRAGLRIGEASALELGDLNFTARLIRVSKNFTNGHLEDATKSGKPRVVDMSRSLSDALHAHIHRLHEQRKGKVPAVALLFPSPTGGYLNAKNWRNRIWYPLLTQAKVARRGPHHLRHTYACRLIEQAIEQGHGDAILVYIKEQLGHSSIQVTIDTYGRLLPSRKERVIDRLESRA